MQSFVDGASVVNVGSLVTISRGGWGKLVKQRDCGTSISSAHHDRWGAVMRSFYDGTGDDIVLLSAGDGGKYGKTSLLSAGDVEYLAGKLYHVFH